MIKRIIIFLFFTTSVFAQVYNDANNRFMLGQNYLQSGDFERAKSILQDLYKTNPQNPQYFDALNKVYVSLKQYDSSITLIEAKIKTTSQNVDLYGLLGSSYYLKGDEQKAFQVWDEALQKFPTGSISYRVIANYALERRAFDKAIEIMKKGEKQAEDPNMFSYDLANLYAMQMAFKDAAKEYCAILSANPNQLRVVQDRINIYINKPDALKQSIEAFEECKTENNIAFDYVLADLYKDSKDYDKAYKYYKAIDEKQGAKGAELFNFAQMLYSDGEYKTASKIFDDLSSNYKNSPFAANARLGYAKTSEALINEQEENRLPTWKPYYTVKAQNPAAVDQVVSAYSDIAKLYPNTEISNEALLRMGKLKLYNENNPSEAAEYFRKLVSTSSMSVFAPEAQAELANIALVNGQLDEAKSLLQKVISSPRMDEEKKNSSKYKLANIYFYQGDFDQARAILTELSANLKDNNANDAIELSLILNTALNDSSNLVIFAQGEMLAGENKFEAAKEEYAKIAQNRQGFILNNLAQIRIAEMELAQDKYETSIELFSKIADENEKNIYADKALYLLGKIYQFGLNNPAKAVEVYESLLAKFPNSLYLDDARDAIILLRNKLS